MPVFSRAIRAICSFAVATAIISACPADGEEADCQSMTELSAHSGFSPGHITSAADRVHFVKDALAQPGCPGPAPACARRAYVVPGDRVIVSIRRGGFVCATYINAKGSDWSGWLPAAAVADDKAEPVGPADWLGKWSRVEADITVKGGKAGALHIEGDATYGAKDTDRVRHGGVNDGEIEADVTPAGDRLGFAIGEDGTLPVDQGNEFTCRVWMQRIGPWLIVSDNLHCGGRHVTFRGIYTRKH
jgi:hypothetical protein